MTLRLSFAFEAEFDSVETAKVFGVALGWALATAAANAEAISESPAPRIVRSPIKVAPIAPVPHG